MKNKTPDEILFEKMRNYCLAPWKSTRVDLPEYGVPVLMAWHHDRGDGCAEIEGFDGYSFGVGARYFYEEIKDGDKKTTICSHLSGDGIAMSFDNFRAIDEAYHVGMLYQNYSYQDYARRERRAGMYGIKDPYLKKKEKEDHIRYDYWINFAGGKFGTKFNNPHAADMSFIPEQTVNAVLKDNKNSGFRFQQLLLNPDECVLANAPDYWMAIPKLK